MTNVRQKECLFLDPGTSMNIYHISYTLPKTNSSPLKIGLLPQKDAGSSSNNHPFSGALAVRCSTGITSHQISSQHCQLPHHLPPVGLEHDAEHVQCVETWPFNGGDPWDPWDPISSPKLRNGTLPKTNIFAPKNSGFQ